MKTLIIAEAGVNHNGDINIAKQLIDVAADAKADMVKFQTFNADSLTTLAASKAEYQTLTTDRSESQHEMLRKLEITENMYRDLVDYSLARGIGIFSTGFDVESVNMLVQFNQQLFKIPSGEITNLPYLRHVGELRKRVILSTGMSEMEEVEAAINTLEESGTARSNIIALHCTSAYPAPMHDINLRAMQTLRDVFKIEVGYSDHSLGIEIAIAAVSLGATVIEKHFTIDRHLPGPDHKASLEPEEFKMMVRSIRNIELALGDGEKHVMPSELANRSIGRKSIVASAVINAGDLFTSENITTKRPGTGLSAMSWDRVLGKTAKRDYAFDEMIEL